MRRIGEANATTITTPIDAGTTILQNEERAPSAPTAPELAGAGGGEDGGRDGRDEVTPARE